MTNSRFDDAWPPVGGQTDACNVLLVFPGFAANSFWNYRATCEIVGAKYPGAPLGLITVAAMLPRHWDIRLVNRNTEKLTDADIAWADMVMTGGMMPQEADTLVLIELIQKHGKPVVVGGPGITSTPEPYAKADFKVLGEAEGLLEAFVADWRAGLRSGTYEGVRFKADVTSAPVPRWDLLKFEDYLHVGVQFSRGCPFTCEFCDIIELYGRVPRTKTTDQILGELDALYALGYRGHVDFVDDNLIGNKKAVKLFLPHLKAWQEKHGYPFEFSTEASVNLADDEELLAQMRDASFFAVFIGIESPDPETLVKMQKKQNTRRDLSESIRKIYDAGIFVMGGFIVGFDTEKQSVAAPIVQLIEDAAIPIAMVGLLYALPNTQLTRRLQKEGRLLEPDTGEFSGDQCTAGLNFVTKRARRDAYADYRTILDRIFAPQAYFERCARRQSQPADAQALAPRTARQHVPRVWPFSQADHPHHAVPTRHACPGLANVDRHAAAQPDRRDLGDAPHRLLRPPRSVLALRDRPGRRADRRPRRGPLGAAGLGGGAADRAKGRGARHLTEGAARF